MCLAACGVDANGALGECDRAVGLIGQEQKARHREVRLKVTRTNRERALQRANRFLRPAQCLKDAAITARRRKVIRIERHGARIRGLREFDFALVFKHAAHAGVGVGEGWVLREQLAEDAQCGVVVVGFCRGARVGETRFFGGVWLDAQCRARDLGTSTRCSVARRCRHSAPRRTTDGQKGGYERTGDRRARGAAVKVSAGEIGLLCPERTHGPSIFGQEPLQPVIRGEIRQKCTRLHSSKPSTTVETGVSCVPWRLLVFAASHFDTANAARRSALTRSQARPPAASPFSVSSTFGTSTNAG